MTARNMTLTATSVLYLSQGDETAFFLWLKRIGCVGEVRGEGHDLFIDLREPPNDDDLRELFALFYRYDVDMRQLAPFAEADWARSPINYWHERVFGAPGS